MAQLANSQTQPNRINILLAEDDEYNSEVVSRFLTAIGYSVAVARDGLEVLEMAQAAIPDLILMDIRMPHLNGLEAIRCLRSMPHLSAIPIIVVTALAMPEDREKCLAAGADEYLSKPFRLFELRRAMERQLAAQQKSLQLLPLLTDFVTQSHQA
ncbi:MAG TPA: response regulator [Anaerolineae bacterium]|nr:response regulator [Anaerolineae bacterium]HMR63736.1 response regulator [Anaerolineae bacterium]